MPRLIDANALMKQHTYLWDEALGTCECVLVEDIENAPTIDAVEVDNAVLVVLQVALEAIRQYRRTVGHDPVFEFSQDEVNELVDYARYLLNGTAGMGVDEGV